MMHFHSPDDSTIMPSHCEVQWWWFMFSECFSLCRS